MKAPLLLLSILAALPLQANSVDQQPLKLASPVYPVQAINKGLEGTVIVCFGIDADGQATDPVVISSTNEIFDQPALDAVAGSLFPIEDGSDSETCWRYRFRL